MQRNQVIKLIIILVVFGIMICGGLLIIILLSEKHKPKEQLQTLLRNDPGCFAPCWQNLTPFSSTEEDFFKLVDNESDKRFKSLNQTNFAGRTIYFWDDRIIETRIEVAVNGGIIESFRFKIEVPLALIIQELGPPDRITAAAPLDLGFYAQLFFFYEKKGVIVEVFLTEVPNGPHPWTTCKLEITPAMLTRSIYFLRPDSPSNMRKGVDYYNGYATVLQDWVGFGDFDLVPCANISP